MKTSTQNRIRRCRAQAAIDAYCSCLIEPDSHDANLTDLLTDLRHWCDARDILFEDCLCRSEGHYEAEKGGAS